MTSSDNLQRPDNAPYVQKGYIPLGYFAADMSGDNSVSHALEYYVADNALSLLADALGKKSDARMFRNRSLTRKKAVPCAPLMLMAPSLHRLILKMAPILPIALASMKVALGTIRSISLMMYPDWLS